MLHCQSRTTAPAHVIAGVDSSKLHVVPIAVNTSYFDPETAVPLPLPMAAEDLVLGRSREGDSDHGGLVLAGHGAGGTGAGSRSVDLSRSPDLRTRLIRAGASAAVHGTRPRPFRFLSTFKWEMRKGWEKLLAAYLKVWKDV